MGRQLTKYSLFIDESGLADLTDYHYKHFILTGVTVPNHELREIAGYFTFIKRRYEFPEDIPFHTYELLEGPNKLTPAQGKSFVNSMCEFIDLTPLEITVIHTNKESFRKMFSITENDLKGSSKAQERRGIIYYLSSIKELELFTSHLNRKGALGFINCDSRTYQDMQLLKAFWALKQDKKPDGEQNAFCQSARQRLVSITFAEKPALSSGVQIADFASFVTYAHTRRKMSSFDEYNLDKVWQLLKKKTKYQDLTKLMDKEEIKKYL